MVAIFVAIIIVVVADGRTVVTIARGSEIPKFRMNVPRVSTMSQSDH
jgi:hypothetical protein